MSLSAIDEIFNTVKPRRPVISFLATGGRFPQILYLFRVRKLEFPVAV